MTGPFSGTASANALSAGVEPPSWVSDNFGITLSDRSAPVGLNMRDMLRLALRRNPKRAQLLVSTVLGKHLAADPLVITGVGRLLGAMVGRRLAGDEQPVPQEWVIAARQAVSGADPAAWERVLGCAGGGVPGTGLLVFGFAETATSVGHLVADQLGADYLHSTRRTDGSTQVAAEFSEPHSHATGHLLRPVDPELLAGHGPLVLVDDELSTGRTALNVIEALHEHNPRERYVLAGLVDVRSDADDLNRLELAERLGCRIDVVSLVRGNVFVPDGTVQLVAAQLDDSAEGVVVRPTAQSGLVSRIDLCWPGEVPHGGRHGFLNTDRARFDAAISTAAAQLASAVGAVSRLLILGTEELMYLPLRLGRELALDPRRQVAFQSTTRSPVHAIDDPGYPIRRRIEFLSGTTSGGTIDGGELVTRFVYNASWPASGAEETIHEADLIVIVDDGHALAGPAGVAGAVAAATGVPVVLAVLA